MPGLMEALCGDDVVRFAPDMESEEKATDDATRYVNHVLFERNDGFISLHDAIKSCLITRIGVVKAYCDKSEVVKEETYREVSQLELQALADDPEVEIVETTPGYGQPGPDGQMTPSFDVLCKRRHEARKFVWEGVPPEEVRISKDCRSIEKVRFIEHRGPRTRSDLVSEGWPKNEVDKLPKWGHADTEDKLQRHSYDQSEDTNDTADPSQEEVEVSESYLRIDYDGDGVAEYRRVVKCHTYVHSNEVTDDHPFAVFSPILMPYKLIGLSFWDLVEDLQRIKTALNRQVLDNVYLSNTPRYAVKKGQVNLDQLLNPVPGGAVMIDPSVAAPDAIMPLTVPFVAGTGMQMIEAVDQVRDKRTGVTELNSALNAASLSKGSVGSEGVQSLMQAGAQRQKLIARVLAETGLKRVYLLMLKLVCQYQDRDAQLRVNGRWMQINPREWRTNYRVNVQVGLGSVDRAQAVANLTLLGQAQQQAAQVGIVQPQNVYALVTRLARALGEREPEKFFTPPEEQPQNQGPPPEVQAEMAKHQSSMQLEQLKQQGAKELAMLNGQIQVQMAQTDAERDIQVENAKQEAQAQQAQLESQNQRDIALFKAQLEADNDRYKADLQAQTDLRKAELAYRQAIDVADVNAESSIVGQLGGGNAFEAG